MYFSSTRVCSWSGLVGTVFFSPAVDPPENLRLFDPGHLGHLEMTWSPPASLTNVTHCLKLYQLEYFNSYTNSWTVIRTPGRSYSAQFDLMKDVEVRVYTVLRGLCTNGTTLMSSHYAEVVQKPSNTGLKNTRVKDFNCVFYNMENMECSWRSQKAKKAISKQHLYFWHAKMERAEECPKYFNTTGGLRRGCNLTEKQLPDFTDINFCINGSIPGKIRPTFFSLQIQNHVKPAKTKTLDLREIHDAQLLFKWVPPPGNVPVHCLEWQVEAGPQGPYGKEKKVSLITEQTSLTLEVSHGSRSTCAKVRSRLHKYCVDKSIWSEWSDLKCHLGKSSTIFKQNSCICNITAYVYCLCFKVHAKTYNNFANKQQ
uniref:Interleukin 13 receptor, alpha 2 n=1 Tax=Cynoglossus semilaevis TaxID=244447 RepID=A0A3P8WXI9_CYNSE